MTRINKSATAEVLQFRKQRLAGQEPGASGEVNVAATVRAKTLSPKLSSPRRHKKAAAPKTGGLILGGLCAIALFTGGLSYWSATAPLSSAVLAPGEIALDTKRKTVQHLEGGIVKEIRVREGQRVEAGDVLFVLDRTRTQANDQVLRAKIASAEQQAVLLREERDTVADLLKQGYSRKPRLLALQRQLAEIEGQIKQDAARLGMSNDTIQRTELRAPVSGDIVDLKVHTVGGVIRAGEVLVSIVPAKERLVIEARVNPNDIDAVRPGLQAQISLTPFSTRQLAPLRGTVRTVSADRLQDTVTGSEYYTARVTVSEQKNNQNGAIELIPGMPAEVAIITGSRTAIDYLLSPLLKSFSRAFRED